MKAAIARFLSRFRVSRSDTSPAPVVASPLRPYTPTRADIARNRSDASPTLPSNALLIVQCSDPMMWYRDKVGQHVPYCGTWPEGYKSREDEGYINIVKFDDARIVQLP